jgi:hypothetical protein
MVTSILYLFIFSSWGIGLFGALLALSMKAQEHAAKMKAAEKVFSFGQGVRFVGSEQSKGIPDELRKLMERSPNHPEVNEIEEDDEIHGVLFKSPSYPPAMDDEEEEETNDQQST